MRQSGTEDIKKKCLVVYFLLEMRRRRPGGDSSNINVEPNGIGWEGKDWVKYSVVLKICFTQYSVMFPPRRSGPSSNKNCQ